MTKVNVNGEIKELQYIDLSGTDCSRDIIGNYDGLNYNEEIEQYVMTEDDFDWWEKILATMEENDEMLDKYDSEKRNEILAMVNTTDLETEVNELNTILKELA